MCLVSALSFKDYIGRIYFIPQQSHFQVVQLRQEVVGLISGQLIMSARLQIDT